MGKLFGTNGVRGYANQDMSPELALKLGKSLGSFLPAGARVLVGRDTRTSGPMLVDALTAGLLSTGAQVSDAGVVPTPALQWRVKSGGDFEAACIVTASHNPPEFNGIKFVDRDGTEYPAEKEDKVEDLFFSEKFRAASWSELHAPRVEPGVNERYVEGILARVDVGAIRARKLTVVLDTSNGAGGLTAPYLLRALGCHVITLNTQPDGTFPGHNSEPTPENVKDLVRAVTAFGADVGVVQDGDADRCVFVTEKGEYVMGDRTLCLAASMAVKRRKGVVVTPVSSSSIVEEAVKAAGGSVIYTRVGAPIVARRMMKENAVIGGEDNGGVIWPEFQHCRDASMTMAKILEFVATEKKPLSQLLAALPQAFLEKGKVKCPNEKKQAALAALAKAHAGSGKVDTTDGVKIYEPSGAWVLVRPSGTEPIFRVYAEAKSAEEAKDLAQKRLAEIEKLIAAV